MNKDQMIIRLDKNLKDKLSQIARTEGKNSSQVVRELIEGYIIDKDITHYIDDLWSRMEAKFKKKKITRDKILTAIRDVRTTKK
ncbi:MAG: CopG family transcriptional regulator [Candidatus Heimdallarchaeota archaeon]|nr:CopG family transcriptional regulator [Candidatus Heimdallarchaeota archaeon]